MSWHSCIHASSFWTAQTSRKFLLYEHLDKSILWYKGWHISITRVIKYPAFLSNPSFSKDMINKTSYLHFCVFRITRTKKRAIWAIASVITAYSFLAKRSSPSICIRKAIWQWLDTLNFINSNIHTPWCNIWSVSIPLQLQDPSIGSQVPSFSHRHSWRHPVPHFPYGHCSWH